MLIGREQSLEDARFAQWTRSEAAAPVLAAQRRFFAERGIPEELMPSCSIMALPGAEWDATTRIDFEVGGQAKRRTLADLERAVDLGLGLGLDLARGFDLTALAPVLSRVRYLSIRGEALTGWRALSDAAQLERLAASPDERVELDHLPRLEWIFGQGPELARALGNPHITGADLTLTKWPAGLTIAAELERLEVWQGSGIATLPPLLRPDRLASLRILQTRSFDLASLGHLPALAHLTIAGRRIRHVEHLTSLPSLAEVFLTGPRELEGWEALGRIRARSVTVHNQTVIPPDAADALTADARSDLRIETRKPTHDERVHRSFAFDEEGLDATTFPPITIEAPGDDGYFLEVPVPAGLHLLGGADVQPVLEDVLRGLRPRPIAGRDFHAEADEGIVHIHTNSAVTAKRIAGRLRDAWWPAR